MSFRISENLADEFENEASLKNITPSNLLTQILGHYSGYDGRTGKAGLVAFPRSLLVRLIEGYPEKQVIAMAELVSKDIMTDMMAILQKDYTVESFLQVIQSWAKTSGMPFRRETKGQLNTCVIQHDLSKNWSVYLGYLFKYVIEDLTQKKVSITMTDNSVRFMF